MAIESNSNKQLKSHSSVIRNPGATDLSTVRMLWQLTSHVELVDEVLDNAKDLVTQIASELDGNLTKREVIDEELVVSHFGLLCSRFPKHSPHSY